ncbi:hypothetical protein [Sulfurimonas sp.]
MKNKLMTSLLVSVVACSVWAADISTYEYAKYKSSNDVKSSLRDAGFKVVGEYDAMSNPDYHVIAYTCKTLQGDASKKDRAFAGVQKVLVDKADNTLVLTNPAYFQSAFLQDDFNADHAKRVNSKLSTAFGTLKGSKDTLEDDDIAGYHFMMAMPYYEDMIEVAEGEGLAQKLEANAKDNIVFKLQLGDATLYGVAMTTDKGEKYYVNEIKGAKHAAFLPYMVMIEDNKAKIMHPKYYLAVSYPNLSMGDFMSISDTPDDIENYFISLFK